MKVFSGIAVGFICLLLIVQSRTEFATIGLKNYYIERSVRLNWHESWNYCAANSMRLVSIVTALEQQELAKYLEANNNIKNLIFWTSGNELASPAPGVANRKFVWAGTGVPITYTNWVSVAPNNLHGREFCIEIRNAWGPGYLWNDDNCMQKYLFICEY